MSKCNKHMRDMKLPNTHTVDRKQAACSVPQGDKQNILVHVGGGVFPLSVTRAGVRDNKSVTINWGLCACGCETCFTVTPQP